MWGRSSKKRRDDSALSIVGRNDVFSGDIRFNGVLLVEGTIQGNVRSEDADSFLRLTETGRIEGEVRVPHVELNGEVHGDVHSSERIELKPHARIAGDVYYNQIEMLVGGTVNGKLMHRPASPKLLAHDPVGQGEG